MKTVEIQCGVLRGWVDADLADDRLVEALAGIRERVGAAAEVLRGGRDRVVRLTLPHGDRELDAVVKAYGPRGALQDWSDARRGSRARRSWDVARVLLERRIHTPAPVACLERWQDGRLPESYFVSRYMPGLSDLRGELIRLYRHDPSCWKLMSLLQTAADGIRTLHDAGVRHGDLGNQNVMLRRVEDGIWEEVSFPDLNRAAIAERLEDRDRARDLSRLYLPSDLRRVFLEMYFGRRPDRGFQRWDRWYRRAYRWHSATRRWRHPLRARRRTQDPALTYPDPRDIWIWDDRSVQAVNVLGRRDRNRLHRRRDSLRMATTSAMALPAVWRRYRRLLRDSYGAPVNMAGRIGMTIEPPPGFEDRELAWLEKLGDVPVLLRCYHHQGETGWRRTTALAGQLAAAGRDVGLAMVQDRHAVKSPASWRAFLESVLERAQDAVTWVEIGHAVNRVKWGVWTLAEQRQLLAPVADLRRRYPHLHFMGPAGIDFEFPYTVAALHAIPPDGRLHACSHHLYVDRRGAPENPQGPFATLEKCALARAIAGCAPGCDDRLILSEVNWPLAGAGVYSPVNSPYDTPGPRSNDPSVSEDAYAAYMIRYLLITLCSGMADRVFWWRLVARGFGLIDDAHPDAWRPRPAFAMLATFLATLGKATFHQRLEQYGAIWHRFRDPAGHTIWVGYTRSEPLDATPPCPIAEAHDAFGNPLSPTGNSVPLAAAPTYVFAPE